MPLNKVQPESNMYQNWVTHTVNPLAGECPHLCSYCSVKALAKHRPAIADKYSGPPRLIWKEMRVNYGRPWRPDEDSPWRTEKTIFVANCSDLFAEGVPNWAIACILSHCRGYPENTYVLQTKNPGGIPTYLQYFPPRFMIGTTAETNRSTVEFSKAPSPWFRMDSLHHLSVNYGQRFLTIEPILQFDLDKFVTGILWANVGKIYIGADSKNHHLPEPTGEEIGALIRALRDAGETVELKSNLTRLYKGE